MVFKNAKRNRFRERKKLGLEKQYDFFGSMIPLWACLTDFMFLYQSVYLLAAVLSIIFEYSGPIFNSVHILSIVVQNPVARNIVMAVIYPIQQLKIAAVVTLFVLYVFSIVQFYFFRSDFGDGECDTLRTCLVYTVNWGMRAGGGIGEEMESVPLLDIPPEGPSPYRFSDISFDWYYRSAFDFIFFLLIIIILMNIVFGIIIDTFSDLRSQRDEKTRNKQTTCFICGIGRDRFDQEGETDFKKHCEFEHNKWDYLFYLIHCQLIAEEEPDSINAYERLVLNNFLASDISWMPLGKAISMGSARNADLEGGKTNANMAVVGSLAADVKELRQELYAMKESLSEGMAGMKEEINTLLRKQKLSQ